jgi:hypothetical protein
MRGYGYTQSRGGFANLTMALTLDSTLGGGAFFGGGQGAGLLGEDTAGTLSSVASFLTEKVPMTGDTISWGLAGAIGAGLALIFALGSGRKRWGTALISLVALALFGLMLAGGKTGDTAEGLIEKGFEAVPSLPDEIVSAGPTVEEALAQREPDCPNGHFAKNGACMSCMVEEVPPAPALSFRTADLGAAWRYASDRSVVPLSFIGRIGADPEPVEDMPLARMVSSSAGLCEADAALVLGSASSDGPADRNEARAKRRADSLAGEVEALCPGLTVYAVSLGQSRASRDSAADRALTVLAVNREEPGAPLDGQAVLDALLRGGPPEGPLTSRLDRFGESWTWVRGGSGEIVPGARPLDERRLVPRDGAPPSCTGRV